MSYLQGGSLARVTVGASTILPRGDHTEGPAIIRNVVTVFKDGIGYDSPKLIKSIEGMVGIN